LRACAQARTGLVLSVLAASLVGPAPALAAGDLNLIPHVPTFTILVVGFALLVIPLNLLIFRPLLGVLEQREKRIAGARERAARLEADADEVLARYQGAVAEVREEAEQQRRSTLDGARAERSEIVAGARGEAVVEAERARSELAGALEEARATLRGSSEQLARDIAAQVLGRPLS
jgi:F-type H+-transporting ATPase subunit b